MARSLRARASLDRRLSRVPNPLVPLRALLGCHEGLLGLQRVPRPVLRRRGWRWNRLVADRACGCSSRCCGPGPGASRWAVVDPQTTLLEVSNLARDGVRDRRMVSCHLPRPCATDWEPNCRTPLGRTDDATTVTADTRCGFGIHGRASLGRGGEWVNAQLTAGRATSGT